MNQIRKKRTVWGVAKQGFTVLVRRRQTTIARIAMTIIFIFMLPIILFGSLLISSKSKKDDPTSEYIYPMF